MPFIKIKGQSDIIEVTQEQGKKVKQFLFDDSVAPDELIDVGRIVIQKRNIVSVLFEQERESGDERYKKDIEEWNIKQNELAALAPRERAERTAWSPFAMFYWAVHRKSPDEAMRENAVAIVTQFYHDHPAWTYPSIKLWYQLLDIPKTTVLDNLAFRVLEKAEYRALQDAKYRAQNI